jgi:hypothetical protein
MQLKSQEIPITVFRGVTARQVRDAFRRLALLFVAQDAHSCLKHQ